MRFLKPTKFKIIAFIILFIIFPTVVAFPNIGQCPPGGPMTCDYGDTWKIMPLGGLFFIGALIYGGNQWFYITTNIVEILKIFYIIIVPYLAACLVFVLHKKLHSGQISK